jgi:hypothetical protein
MRYSIKISAVLIFLLILIGCGGDDTHEIIRGAEFRAVEITSASFELCDPSSSYTMTAEVEDYENGSLLDYVSVFVSFIDIADDGRAYPTAEEQLTVIDGITFTQEPDGLPTTTFTVTLGDVSSALNIASYDAGDIFKIRFEIHLTDGRTISSYDEIPFTFDATITAPVIGPDYFAGEYLMEQVSGTDPYLDGETFGDTQIVTIVADGNKRSFDFVYYPGVYDADYHFSMSLVCGEIFVTGTINDGALGCGDVNFTDDVITVNVTDFDPNGGCDEEEYQVVLRFTKQ